MLVVYFVYLSEKFKILDLTRKSTYNLFDYLLPFIWKLFVFSEVILDVVLNVSNSHKTEPLWQPF